MALSNDKHRRKKCHSITLRSCCRTQLNIFISGVCRSAYNSFGILCLLKNEPITLCLTDFYFHRTVCKQKNIWRRNVTIGQYFRYVVKMGPKPKKKANFGYSKVTVVVLISHFRGMVIVIFRKIKCNEE